MPTPCMSAVKRPCVHPKNWGGGGGKKGVEKIFSGGGGAVNSVEKITYEWVKKTFTTRTNVRVL